MKLYEFEERKQLFCDYKHGFSIYCFCEDNRAAPAALRSLHPAFAFQESALSLTVSSKRLCLVRATENQKYTSNSENEFYEPSVQYETEPPITEQEIFMYWKGMFKTIPIKIETVDDESKELQNIAVVLLNMKETVASQELK